MDPSPETSPSESVPSGEPASRWNPRDRGAAVAAAMLRRGEDGATVPAFRAGTSADADVLPSEPSPAPRPDPRAWGAAVALAALLLAVDGAMVWAFRVRPWTLVVPGAVLAIALRGRNASLASWRDALGVLCLATVPLVGLLPMDFPRPARFALNSLGTAGLVLLALGLILGEGLGAAARGRSTPLAREALRRAGVRIGELWSLVAVATMIGFLWSSVRVPGLLLTIPALAIAAGLCPVRWPVVRGFASIGCLVLLVAIGGAWLRAWPWATVTLALVPIYLPNETRRWIVPVPPKEVRGTRRGRNLPARPTAGSPAASERDEGTLPA